MDPVTGMLGGMVGGSILDFTGQMITNAQNKAIATEALRSQETMSSTAYQRAVADLRAAGLNPILAATKLGGASTPSAPVAKMENPASGMGDKAARMAEVLMTNARVQNETKVAEATIAEKQAAASQSAAQTAYYEALTTKLGPETEIARSDAETRLRENAARILKIEQDTAHSAADTKFINEKRAITEQIANLAKKLGPIAKEGVDNVRGIYEFLKSGTIADYLADKGEAFTTELRAIKGRYDNANQEIRDFVNYLFRMMFTTKTQ